jgi:hypothetical protein
MTGEYYTIIILGIIIVLQLLFIRNLLLQTEKLDDLVISTRANVLLKVRDSLKKMKETDLRGAFESDDEVGAVFKDMKQIIEDLEKEI